MKKYLNLLTLLLCSLSPFLAQGQCETRTDPYTRQQILEARVIIKEATPDDPTEIKARFYRRGQNNLSEFTITAPHLTENSRVNLNDYFGIQCEKRRAICFIVLRDFYTHKNPDGSYSITITCSATLNNFLRLAENEMLGYRYTMQGIEYDHKSPVTQEAVNQLKTAMACWKLP